MNKGLAFLGLLAGMVATAFGGNVTNHVAVDQTWTAAGSPYNICYWDCTVQAGATLTIEPGVRVNFGSRSGQNWTSGTATLANALKIEGTLLADGATFTSYAPDEDPQAGDWSNLQFLDGSMGRLTNCTIEYGGAGAVTYGQVQLHGASDVEFDGCTFRNAENRGIYASGDATGRVAAAGCTFSNLSAGVVAARDSGIEVEATGSLFEGLDYGMHLLNASAAIDGCTFTNVANEDVLLWESYVDNWWCKTATLTGNRFYGGGKEAFPVAMYGGVNFAASGNAASGYAVGEAGVRVGGWVNKGRTATWGSNDMGYAIVSTVTVDADAGSRGRLTIADGNRVYVWPGESLRSWGDLAAEGTSGVGITFTTGGTNAAAGHGILFDNYYGVADLRHCRFERMAKGVAIADARTNAARVTLDGCTFSNLADRAIQANNCAGVDVLTASNTLVTESGQSFYANNGGRAKFVGTDFVESGPVYGVSGSEAEFEDCNFHGLGVYAETGFLPKHHTSLGGAGARFALRHCTVAGNRGCGIRVTESGSATLDDCIVWNNEFGSFGEKFGGSYTARTSCVQGTYPPGTVVDCTSNAPGFVGWVGGASTVYVNATSPCPGAGTAEAPHCSLARALREYRENFDYGLAAGSPCIGTGSGGSNMGAENGTGAGGTTAMGVQIAAGTYGMGGEDLLLDVSLHGDGPESVTITNTIRGLRDGAVAEGLTAAWTEGAGIEIKGPVSPTIRNCDFRNLTGTGIGIDLSYGWEEESGRPEIDRCRVYGMDYEYLYRYGIQLRGNGGNLRPTVRNCLLQGIDGATAALQADGARATIENCTVAGNASPGAVLCNESQMANSILHGNTTDLGGPTAWSDNRPVLSNCLFEAVAPGAYYREVDCLHADPRFADAGGGDYGLSGYSPCLGRGTNQGWMAGAQDLGGDPRLAGTRVDMGAYEYQGAALRVTPGTWNVNNATGTIAFAVENAGAGTMEYAAATTCEWLQVVSGAVGTNGGTIEVRRAANPQFAVRTGEVTVVAAGAGGSPATAYVVQDRVATLLTIQPTNNAVGGGASGGWQIAVSANTAWTATNGANSGWLTLTSGQAGTTNGTVAYSVAANTGASARTGTVRVAGGGILRIHTVVQAGGGAAAWDDGYTDLGGGWRRLGWFGDYAAMELEGWIWHHKHGFFYVAETSAPGDVWLFANDMGWLYTGNALYPFLYRASDGAWIWYNGSTNPRWFMNFTSGQWESRP